MTPSNRVIDFLIIGAAKCATTSFHHYLDAHPDIFLPTRKGVNHETGYFLTPGAQSIKGLTNDMIRKDADVIFDLRPPSAIMGERSTDYAKFPFRTVDFNHIRRHNPHMKFLYFTGDPIKHLIKLYRHHLTRNPRNTLADFPQELKQNQDYYESIYSYRRQLHHYLDLFGADKVRAICVDSLETRTEFILSQIFDFLGVPPFRVNITEHHFNVNPRQPHFELTLPPDLEKRLRIHYNEFQDLCRQKGIYIS